MPAALPPPGRGGGNRWFCNPVSFDFPVAAGRGEGGFGGTREGHVDARVQQRSTRSYRGLASGK